LLTNDISKDPIPLIFPRSSLLCFPPYY